jgi:rRNA maturation RNase YbeY
MVIEINNLTNFKINQKSFSQVAKIVLKGENRETESLSLAFVEKEEIKKLNKRFRNKDKSTDVLSFDIREGKFLGEIVICPEVVKEKKEDIIEVFIHGILHLCGYDHERSSQEERAMEKKQENYLKNIKK